VDPALLNVVEQCLDACGITRLTLLSLPASSIADLVRVHLPL